MSRQRDDTMQMATKLWAHQQEALNRLKGKKAFGLFMAMRTGKTLCLIADWARLADAKEVDDLLVIAPTGAYRAWADELEKHLPPTMRVNTRTATWISADPHAIEKVGNLIRTPTQGPRVLIMNVEALSSAPLARIAAGEFMASSKAAMVAVDESTTVKNEKAERTKMVWALGNKAEYRRILSGLPTPRTPLDLWGQFEFLDHNILNFVSFTAFMERYADIRKMRVGKKHIVKLARRYKNLDELRAKIEPYSYRVRLEDCADIPPKLYVTRDIELTGEQQRIYDDLEAVMEAQLRTGEYVSTTEIVVQMLRMHQVCCGHVTDEQGKRHDIPSKRIDALVDLLEDYDGKAVVWCSYAYDLERICQSLTRAFGGNAVALFWGGNQNVREEESRRFKENDRCRFMVATPASGGRGRTWSEANLLVYFSNTNNLEYRDQSEERASAVGKTDKVTIVDLMARGTVEEKIIAALRKKIDLAAIITGDNWRRWVV